MRSRSIWTSFLDGESSLDIAATRDLDLGDTGTIEFLVAAEWEEDPDYFPCVLASRDVYDGDDPEGLAAATRYSVHITGDRAQIGLWNGRDWAAVPFDFSDAEFHRVAIVTRGARSTIVVDGEIRGELEIGYGAASGLPFHVGSADGASDFFGGAISSLRLWRAALSPEVLAGLGNSAGPPPPDHPDAPHLVAYSSFSATEPTLVLAEPAPRVGPYACSSCGRPASPRSCACRSCRAQVRSIRARRTTSRLATTPRRSLWRGCAPRRSEGEAHSASGTCESLLRRHGIARAVGGLPEDLQVGAHDVGHVAESVFVRVT